MTKVKVCGITGYKDAVQASSLGADYLGFNFYSGSPRFIEKSKAKIIISRLPKRVKKVGVFVNEGISKVKETAGYCGIDIVQLSGDEGPSYVSRLGKLLNRKIIKAFRIKSRDGLKSIGKFNADYIMLDSFSGKAYGGTGRAFDWKLAKPVDKSRLFLAGGLNISNVGNAIKELKPFAVDVCSGIEKSPGVKDFKKMSAFIKAVK